MTYAVGTTELPRPPSAICTVDSMRDTLIECLRARIDTQFTFEELLGEEVVERNKAGKPVGVVPDFELRHKRWKGANEAGIVGRVSTTGWRAIVELQLDNFEQQLKNEQPDGDWRLVAAFIETRPTVRAHPVSSGGAQGTDVSVAALASKVGNADHPDGPGVIAFKQAVGGYQGVPDFRRSVRLAYADVSQGELTDPSLRNAPDGFSSKRYERYIEHRQLRYMPEGLRKNRRAAVELLRMLLAAEQRIVAYDSAEAERTRRAQTRASISSEQLEIAAEMVHVDHVPVGKVAALLRLDTDALEAALERMSTSVDASPPSPSAAPTEPARPASRGRKAAPKE